MTDKQIQKAHLLIEQKRYSEAENALRQILSQEPSNAELLTLLAICLKELDKTDDAIDAIQLAIGSKPDYDPAFYIYALLLYRKGKNKEAMEKIRAAIAFNPYQADYFGVMAQLNLNNKDFDLAYENAAKGLAINAENIFCLNVQSAALVKLGRKEDAYTSIEKALDKDPHNSFTHANFGWGLLEKGEHKKALKHFRESLRIDPTSEYAKAGLVEAMKARYLPYRLFLNYGFWMSKLRGKYQWFVIIGFYLLYRALNMVSEQTPALKPFITPLLIIMLIMAVSTWILRPLSNLFLRLNVYGRYALSKEEITTSNFVGISVLIGLLGFVYYLFNSTLFAMGIAIYGFSMMIPLSHMYGYSLSSKQNWRKLWVLALALLGLAALANVYINNDPGPAFSIYVLGVLGFQIMVNIQATK
ncbi:MAG: tetratricopeptide repeat protein [Cyclobacteriaceae bacterium]